MPAVESDSNRAQRSVWGIDLRNSEPDRDHDAVHHDEILLLKDAS
jgi:hypothetical protein